MRPTRSFPRSRARRAVALGVLLALPFLAGCFGSTVAHVPAAFLGGDSGNGWRENVDARESTSAYLGSSRVDVRVYQDDGKRGGYPATMSVATLKSFLSPSEESLLTEIRARVQSRAEKNGIALVGDPDEGRRSVADGHETRYFIWEGKVSQRGSLFQAEDSNVRIVGEVWDCREAGTSVVVVGLAQTTNARSVGGVPVSRTTNAQNWAEIVADPEGTIQGFKGSSSLAWNVACT